MVTERRERHRHNAKELIALTSKGVAQVVNLSTKGMYIRFTNNVHFPNYSVMDIYDSTGFSMVEVHAKKVWSKTLDNQNRYSYKPFKSEIFAEFENLSLSQECQLVFYLSKQKD
ncbi:MAG: hypothetical protein GY799_28175 [Desulfobulbaceae bacterium]|nr:hypothetical protein [Desulfobulbaceae bacterium]